MWTAVNKGIEPGGRRKAAALPGGLRIDEDRAEVGHYALFSAQ
jgi:hypothetical protein